jgi:hypothetical protein
MTEFKGLSFIKGEEFLVALRNSNIQENTLQHIRKHELVGWLVS